MEGEIKVARQYKVRKIEKTTTKGFIPEKNPIFVGTIDIQNMDGNWKTTNVGKE